MCMFTCTNPEKEEFVLKTEFCYTKIWWSEDKRKEKKVEETNTFVSLSQGRNDNIFYQLLH